MDKDIEKKLKDFESVWRRVTGSSGGAAPVGGAAMMPRKKQPPKRRFDPPRF